MSTAPAWFVIVNPAAGSGRGPRRWQDLAAALRVEGVGFEAAVTREPGHCEELAGEAVRAGFRRLLSVGGDGTLHEALNGALGAAGPAVGRDLVLAVAPFGTGNDWARGRGVPSEPLALARCIARAAVARCDVGRVEFTGAVPVRRRYFMNVAGAGIDAQVLASLPAGPARRAAYLLGLVRALLSYRPPELSLRFGSLEETGPCLLALAANGPYCGNGMRLAPDARPDDGLLDVVSVAPLPLLSALRRLPRLFDGRLAGEPWVRTRRVARVEILAAPPTAVEADGQIVGTTPVSIEVVAGAVQALAGGRRP
jgi:YegS/Rv2252/BmrU family lipid kinase